MSCWHRGGFRSAAVLFSALFALALGLVPATDVALAEESSVAHEIAENLYVPDGVEMGVELSEDGYPLGLSPEYGRLETGGGVAVQTELPARFDLRDVNGVSYVSPVKDQYRWSDCWVFATLGSLESNLLMQGRGGLAGNDLSELQLTQARRTLVSDAQATRLGAAGQAGEGIAPLIWYVFGHPDNQFLQSYGYIYETSDAMFAGMGPVAESSAPFGGSGDDEAYRYWVTDNGTEIYFPSGSSSWALDDPYALDPVLWLDESRYLGTPRDGHDSPDWDVVDSIKRALMEDGAVAVGIAAGSYCFDEDYAYDQSYNPVTHAQYYYWDQDMHHFVTIVGWDDTFSRNNFAVPAPGDGAWIIKESYGTRTDALWPTNTSGYRYVSYYDNSLSASRQLIAGPDASSDDVILQYDLLGLSPFSGELLTDEKASSANIFRADQDMLLEATTAAAGIENSTVRVEVYLLGEGASNPTDGQLASTTDVTFPYIGRYRVGLNKPVEIRVGQRFSIVETVSSYVEDGANSGTKYYLAFETGITEAYAENNGFTFLWHAKANPGESWVMAGGMWDDAQTLNDEANLTANGENFGNALIKAYGSEADFSQQPAPDYGQTAAMHRLYNQWTGEHFYTASAVEKDSLVAVGWTYEGVGWTAPAFGELVYRLYNPWVAGGDHHYTTSVEERDALVAVGWRSEGVGWCSAGEGGVPLYRQYNPYATTGTHNYTASESENDALVAVGWLAEGVAWYGVS